MRIWPISISPGRVSCASFQAGTVAIASISYSPKNERALVLFSLAAVVAAGAYTTLSLGDGVMMAAMDGQRGPAFAVLLFAMWSTMMMAMMLPSAAPAVLLFMGLNRRLVKGSGGTLAVAAFISGYLVVWTGFSAAAVAMQIVLGEKIALDMMMATASVYIGGGLLMAAGIYQMSPAKAACLRKCQAPLIYFARHWQSGTMGAGRMGLAHGLYCIGCCWALMGLLFYGGVMQPIWIVGLAIYVAAEKVIPASNTLSRFSGLVLIGWGLWTVWPAH